MVCCRPRHHPQDRNLDENSGSHLALG
jgi:hypothetical protein